MKFQFILSFSTNLLLSFDFGLWLWHH